VGPRRWLNETLRWPDTAAAVLTCLANGLEPEPWVTAVNKLARLSRSDLRKELASRHGWSCHICGKEVPRSLREIPYSVARPDPLFPDIEHVIPLTMGGAHWWSNLRLAHRRCNLQKAASDIGHEGVVEDFMRELEARGID
jgi:5-methylcytosine-specific restriction endonuclease McrA